MTSRPSAVLPRNFDSPSFVADLRGLRPASVSKSSCSSARRLFGDRRSPPRRSFRRARALPARGCWRRSRGARCASSFARASSPLSISLFQRGFEAGIGRIDAPGRRFQRDGINDGGPELQSAPAAAAIPAGRSCRMSERSMYLNASPVMSLLPRKTWISSCSLPVHVAALGFLRQIAGDDLGLSVLETSITSMRRGQNEDGALDEDEQEQPERHQDADGETGGGEPDPWLAFPRAAGAREWVLAVTSGSIGQTIRFRSRRRWRRISAKVFMTKVIAKSTIAPRNSAR